MIINTQTIVKCGIEPCTKTDFVIRRHMEDGSNAVWVYVKLVIQRNLDK